MRHDIDELNEILDSRYKILKDNKNNVLNFNATELSKDFFAKYKLRSELKQFAVNSFEQIGWVDPFPDDKEHFSVKCCGG